MYKRCTDPVLVVISQVCVCVCVCVRACVLLGSVMLLQLLYICDVPQCRSQKWTFQTRLTLLTLSMIHQIVACVPSADVSPPILSAPHAVAPSTVLLALSHCHPPIAHCITNTSATPTTRVCAPRLWIYDQDVLTGA